MVKTGSDSGDSKVSRTRGQECPRYVAQAFQPAGSGDILVPRVGFPLEVFCGLTEFAPNSTMNNTRKIAETQPSLAGGPPRPPKMTARDLADDSHYPPHIDIPDPVAVKELASALQTKPFKVVADIMRFGVFVNSDESVEFETASRVAWKHGVYARRVG